MTRVETIGRATLYLGDCRDILPTLPKVDAVVTDPVWPNNSIADFSDVVPAELFSEAAALLSADRIAVHLGCDSDPSMLAAITLPFFRVCWLRYARPHYKGRLLYGADVAYLYGAPPASRSGAHVVPGEACKTQSSGRVTEHPCERSEEHTNFLVDKWSAPADTVLDPFMGSGTTGASAVRLGRSFVGIEREPKYFDIACKRIEEAQRQGDMFIDGAASPTDRRVA